MNTHKNTNNAKLNINRCLKKWSQIMATTKKTKAHMCTHLSPLTVKLPDLQNKKTIVVNDEMKWKTKKNLNNKFTQKQKTRRFFD